jgi:hypothetical protein
MKADTKRQPYVSQDRILPGADALEEAIRRNVVWATAIIVASVRALRKDGRPPFTEKLDATQRIMKALTAPPEFWDALMETDPEQAAQLAADVIKARMKGKIPDVGPLATQAEQLQEDEDTPALPQGATQ